MDNEKSFQQTLFKKWQTYPSYFVYERVENRINNGTPDITYTLQQSNGWLELKVAKIVNDVITFKHWTPQQRIWLKRHKSPRNFLFLKVEKSLYLLSYENALKIENTTVSEAEIVFFDVLLDYSSFTKDEFFNIILSHEEL